MHASAPCRRPPSGSSSSFRERGMRERPGGIRALLALDEGRSASSPMPRPPCRDGLLPTPPRAAASYSPMPSPRYICTGTSEEVAEAGASEAAASPTLAALMPPVPVQAHVPVQQSAIRDMQAYQTLCDYFNSHSDRTCRDYDIRQILTRAYGAAARHLPEGSDSRDILQVHIHRHPHAPCLHAPSPACTFTCTHLHPHAPSSACSLPACSLLACSLPARCLLAWRPSFR